jgi:hypothetical protein
MTFDDDFGDDASEWNLVGDDDGDPCTHSSGALHITDQQNCYFEGTGHGIVPTSRDQWAFYDFGAYTTISQAGPVLRGKTVGAEPDRADATDIEYNYLFEWETSTGALFRACDGEHSSADRENDCDNIESFDPDEGTPTADSGVIFAVAGEGESDTEFAVWLIDDIGATDYCDPANWGVATLCISNNGTIDEPKMIPHCNCPIDCDLWGADPDAGDAGYPAIEQLYVGYGQTGSAAQSAERFCGGNL